MGIDIRRLLVGGGVAGLTIILSALAMVPIVGNEMEMALARFGLPPMSRGAMTFVVAESIVLGMTLVWLYAVVQPRMKPGRKTAIVVAWVVWLLAYFFPNAGNVMFGFMPVRLTVIGTTWGLVELVVAGLVGAHFYREK